MTMRNYVPLTAFALLVGVFVSMPTGAESVGVCNGMHGNNLPPASAVVKLYQSNGIKSMRIYAPDPNVLKALRGTGITLIVDIGGTDTLMTLASDSVAAAGWVKDNVLAYYPDVSFKYIAVGNEVNVTYVKYILPAMENVYTALKNCGLADKIKVSTVVYSAVLGVSFPPSAGAFSSNYSSNMTLIVKFLVDTGAPLLANVYPYFAHADNPTQVPLNYALFTSPATVVTDGSNQYQNLFDAMVDAFYSAVEKAGGSTVRIVVTETGWPTAGGTDTSVANAKIYNQNLINHVGKGTPKRPTALETYIFAMFNENEKDAGVEQHWGLFYPNEQPVYTVTFN